MGRSIRNAVYLANLLLLAVIVKKRLRLSQLFGPDVDVPEKWRRCALLWKSQLTDSSWGDFVDTLNLRNCGTMVKIAISKLRVDVNMPGSINEFNPEWLLGRRTSNKDWMWVENSLSIAARDIYFLCGTLENLMANAIQPPDLAFPYAWSTCAKDSSGKWASAMHALVGLLFAKPPFGEADTSADFQAYFDKCREYFSVLENVRSRGNASSIDGLILSA